MSISLPPEIPSDPTTSSSASILRSVERACLPFAPLRLDHYGSLLGICLSRKIVVATSSNSGAFLDICHRSALGKLVSHCLPDALQDLIKKLEAHVIWPVLAENFALEVKGEIRHYNIIAEKVHQFVFLSFELIQEEYSQLISFFDPLKFNKAEAQGNALEQALWEIKNLTRCSQITLVRFKAKSKTEAIFLNSENSLEVVKLESGQFQLAQKRGLHTLRNISHRLLVPNKETPGSQAPIRVVASLDAQRALLEHVSLPIHAPAQRKPLSAFSNTNLLLAIPLRQGNNIWGLLLCEGSEATHMDFRTRIQACTTAQYLTNLLSLSFQESLPKALDFSEHRLTPLRSTLLRGQHATLEEIAADIQSTICEVLELDGIAFVSDHATLPFGSCPPMRVLTALRDACLNSTDPLLVAHTSSLSDWIVSYDEGETLAQGGAQIGAIYIPCLSQYKFAALGFRSSKRNLYRNNALQASVFRSSFRPKPWTLDNISCARKLQEILNQYLVRPTVVSRH